jgi:TolB-like protein/tetratricopeptide (TPR) repeat protein
LAGRGIALRLSKVLRQDGNMLYRFETFELDTQRRELRNAGKTIAVEPQVFDLLEYLVRNRERVVSKDDIIASVWGGRVVSDSTLTSRINSVRSAVGDTGAAQRLLKTMRRRGIRFVGAVTQQATRFDQRIDTGSSEQRRSNEPHPSDKTSIVILPFVNLSADAAQDYFADGMVEDITMALGRLPWLFVIASASAFTYKGRRVDARQAGTELGVRYVLQGSVRKAGDRIRIAVQLTDASSGRQLFSNRFEGKLQDVFSIQDRVATQLTAAIAPALRLREVDRARRTPTKNLTAYDLFLRALPPRRDDLVQNGQSLRLLYQAIELDPSFSTAYGLAAWCHEIQAVFGWLPRSEPRVLEGLRLARIAADLGDDDPDALWMAGITVTTLAGELEWGAALIDKSIAINPNSARAWWASGVTQTYLGQSKVALMNFARARQLNPLDTAAYAHWTAVATVHFFAGNYGAAEDALTKALVDWPDAPPALRLKAAVCGLLGRNDEGRKHLRRLLTLIPDSTIESTRAQIEPYAGRTPSVLEAWLQGLRRSGLAHGAGKPGSNVTRLRLT